MGVDMLIMISLCGNVTAKHTNLYNQYGWIIISDFYKGKGRQEPLSQRPTTLFMQRIRLCNPSLQMRQLLALPPPMVGKCSSFSLKPLYAQAAVGRRHLFQGRVFPSPLALFGISLKFCPEARLVFESRPNGVNGQD